MILGVATGRLITVEGLDGAGKTTLVAGLTRELAARGRELLVLREPGGVELSERIRVLVKDPELSVDPRAEALLYAAARAQLVSEQLVPLLESGQWVLLDRFVDSSLAYQGAGRGLGVEAIRCAQRARHRRPAARPHAAAADRPGRGARPHRRPRPRPAGARAAPSSSSAVADAYDELAAAEPDRIAVIDAAQPPERVLADALAAIGDVGDG